MGADLNDTQKYPASQNGLDMSLHRFEVVCVLSASGYGRRDVSGQPEYHRPSRSISPAHVLC